MIFSTILLIACSKEEPSITNTTWDLQFTGGSSEIKYTSDSTYTFLVKEISKVVLKVDGKYKYNHPNVEMKPILFVLYENLNGTIVNDKMKVVNGRGVELGDFIKLK